MNIKAIIFDWSGVISDSVDRQLFVTNELFKEFGAKEITLKELKETWIQPYMVFYNKYLPNLSVEAEQEAYNRYVKKYSNKKAFEGIQDVLKRFQKQGIKMAVLTSDPFESFSSELKSFNLENVFIDFIYDKHDKLEGAREIIERNNFEIQNTIIIGDSNHEIEIGKEIGILTGAVTWGFCTKEILEATKPDFIINSIEELEKIILGGRNN